MYLYNQSQWFPQFPPCWLDLNMYMSETVIAYAPFSFRKPAKAEQITKRIRSKGKPEALISPIQAHRMHLHQTN